MSLYIEKTAPGTSLDFKHLPAFAQFVFENRLEEYVQAQFDISKRIGLHLLKYLSHLSEAQLLKLSRESSGRFLSFFINNNAKGQIEESLREWMNDQLPEIRKNQIIAEDIGNVNFLRKESLLKFIPEYTSDLNQAINIIREIDVFILESEKASIKMFVELQQEQINEHLLFIEKIAGTSPSLIYVYDELSKREIYTNKKIEDFTGISSNELDKMGDDIFSSLIHPEDLPHYKSYLKTFHDIRDGEIMSVEYRIRENKGQYRWLRAYETVFKRKENGAVWQKIGVVVDIHPEKVAVESLKEQEQALLEAQELTKVGSFEWDFVSHEVNATPQLKKILEIDRFGDMEKFMKRIHPEDVDRVKLSMKKAIENNELYEEEYRLKCGEREKVIWSRGTIVNENGKLIMRGTIMDITDRHNMVSELKKSEELYKQAQAIAHIGNYTWDYATGKFTWSDELYRIYEWEIGSPLSDERMRKVNHPDDDSKVWAATTRSIENNEPYDYNYRIITDSGKIKTLHARGEIVTEPKTKKVLRIIGTVEDVSSRFELLQEAERSRDLYKQAALLAKMGNWTWNVRDNTVAWSDELYDIHEIDRSSKATFELFMNSVHPEDRLFVQSTLKKALETHELDYHLRIITGKGKVKTLHTVADVKTDAEGKAIFFIGTAQDVTEKENLLNQLQLRDDLYKQAQAIAQLGNWTWDMKTNSVTWTDEVYRIYGLEPQSEVITYERYMSLVHPDDREIVISHITTCLEKNMPYDFFHRVNSADGKLKIVESKGEVVLDKENKPIKLVGTVQDVTQQQRIQEELKEKTNFVQKIADAAPSIIASYNIKTGKYLFINKGMQTLLGYDPKLVLDKGIEFFSQILHPQDLPRIMEENARVLEQANSEEGKKGNEIIAEFRYRMKHKNGKYRWFHTYGTVFDRDASGEVEMVLNISLDITEQVEATEKIREQEHFISHIADASPTVLYLFDAIDGKVIYINKEAEAIVGYTPEEIVAMGSKVIPNLYHPEDVARIGPRLRSYKDANDAKAMFQFEVRMKHKQGGWRWLLIREIVFKQDEEGRITEILGAALDITNRKKMESELFLKTLELQQSNSSLGEFAYVASHDLKEPLRKISTFGDLLMSNSDKLNEEGQMYLNKIIESSKRMQLLIDDLLSVSLISNQKNYETRNVKEVLQEVIQSLDFKIEEKQARIKLSDLPELNIVPAQFRQLFQNLLSNSLKYTRNDVAPKITISHKYLKPSEVVKYPSLSLANRYLEIRFSDNGIGFEQVFAEKIFTIFQRLHSRYDYEGTGIGLAICKKIVENHGGIIYANGRPGKGAEFVMVFPVL